MLTPPIALIEQQKWVAQAISSLPNESILDSELHIHSSLKISSEKRILIYKNNFWRSLCNTLHKIFPFSSQLIGEINFNEKIAIPYLCQASRKHWDLLRIADELIPWFKKSWRQKNKKLFYFSLLIDWLCFQSYREKKTSSEDCRLQPHVKIICSPYNFLHLREAILKKNSPSLLSQINQRQCHYLIYRKPNGNTAWENLSLHQFIFLKKIQKGASLKKAINLICAKPYYEDPLVVQQWIYLGLKKDLFGESIG